MTFANALDHAGYLFDERTFGGCYIKWSFRDGVIHVYQRGEDEGEWNYVKMTEDYDVLTEVTFNPDENSVPVFAN
jgi:hypothetical protein